MGRFEERSNDQKEECLDFCMEESDSIRVLGSWVGMKEDVNMRLRRAGGLWAKVNEQLKNTRLSKKWQARIVLACVESALLFDCQARVWWSVGDAVPEFPTRTSPVTCGLAGLGGVELRRRVTREGGCWGGEERTVGARVGRGYDGGAGRERGRSGEGGRRWGCE